MNNSVAHGSQFPQTSAPRPSADAPDSETSGPVGPKGRAASAEVTVLSAHGTPAVQSDQTAAAEPPAPSREPFVAEVTSEPAVTETLAQEAAPTDGGEPPLAQGLLSADEEGLAHAEPPAQDAVLGDDEALAHGEAPEQADAPPA